MPSRFMENEKERNTLVNVFYVLKIRMTFSCVSLVCVPCKKKKKLGVCVIVELKL